MDIDPFNEDEADRRFLLSKPTCFVVFGKPGSGKSTLARKFAKVWKCVLVTIPDAMQSAIECETENGKKAQEYLCKGEAVPESLILEILIEKLNSPEVMHRGYILKGFPMLSTNGTSIEEQLNMLKTLPMPPDYIINLKIADNDLIKRISGVKVDPVTNNLYTKEFYEKEFIETAAQETKEDGDENEEGDEEEGSDVDDDESSEDEELLEDLDREEQTKELIERLVVRKDELSENLSKKLKNFRKLMLRKFEDYITENDQQKVIELDAILPAKNLYKNLIEKLDVSLLARAVVPQRLQGGEDQEEIPEDMDTEDMLRSLAVSEMIAPGFRWRRSRWSRLCPVALYEGECISGNPEFAVSFLDKMYLLSSVEALVKFMKNPRPYVLPPQPTPPCKLMVLGAPLSGVTTLCTKLADRFGGKVFNIEELIAPRRKEVEEQLIKDRHSKLLADCIAKVKADREAEMLARKVSVSDNEEDFENDDEETESKKEEEEETSEIIKQDIDENHPMVLELMDKSTTVTEEPIISADEYVDCLEQALLKMYEGTEKGPSAGGWILDNFPNTREQFNMMVDRGIVPDDVFVFRDDSNNEILINRWIEKNNADTSTNEGTELLQKYQDSLTNFDRNWTSLQSTMRNANSIEPLLIHCKQDEEEAFTVAANKMEGVFQYHGWEYTGMDQDEEEEDLAALEEEEDEDDDEDPNKKKPFGETRHFCPVMLKEQNVLWPGSSECAVKYREKIYFLSNAEARETFLQDPEMFLPQSKPLKPPPVRLLLLGPKGSGKTLHGKLLAKKFGVFHISFKDRLQELIIHKTMKKIGPEFEVKVTLNESNAEEDKSDASNPAEDETGEKEETIEEDTLTEFEENIRNNILENEPLSSETLDEILMPWWKEEPYRTYGFILEGFPRTAEEARYLAATGLFPDVTISLNVSSDDVCNRLMPPLLDKWIIERNKSRVEKEKKKEEKLKKREEEKKRRKEEKLLEREERLAEKAAALRASGEDDEEEDAEEEEEEELDLDEMIELEMYEEFGDIEEDEEEEETQEEAVERINTDLAEKCDEQMLEIENVLETLDDLTIPRIDVEAGRKPHITQYVLMKTLKQQVQFRSSLFDRCQSITSSLAKKLLNSGYKLPSRFGRWCPVRLYEGDVIAPYVSKEMPSYPVVYRKHIYYLSNEENKERFMQSPQLFLQQSSPKPLVPIKLAIIGPPKSGKTTLANRFVQEHGVARLSIGEAIRKILQSHPSCELVEEINEHLFKGMMVPDELATEALELYLLDPQCVTRGFVLDGYPVTTKQMELLRERSIIPHKVIELSIPDHVIMQRGAADRKSPSRVYPLHDSLTILAIRVACHRKESEKIREFYDNQYKNLVTVDGLKSKWWIYSHSLEKVQHTVSHIQSYIENIAQGKAASISCMCVTPKEFYARLEKTGEYCPVSLARDGQLVDCSKDKSNNLAAEFEGKYYKFSSQKNLNEFLNCPSKYVPPLAPHTLPENLPTRRSAVNMKNLFPVQIEMKGYCPVTYLNGKLRYEALVPGEADLIVEYKQKFYSLCSEECLEQMMRCPKKYSSLTLPEKLPPKREPLLVSALPMLGYMEQTVSSGIIKALTAVGCLKPKYPFLTAKRSALLYMAYHLKAFNPNANQYVRKKYKKKLQVFEDDCNLISYLSKIMRRKYIEPEDRPIDFDHKLSSFKTMKSVQA